VPPAFENAAIYQNSETNFIGSSDCTITLYLSMPRLMKLSSLTPENHSAKMPHSLKLHGEDVLNHQ